MINVLQIMKRYVGNYPLLNEMVRLDPARFRTTVCYLGGQDDGRNRVEEVAKTYYLGCRSGHLRWYNGKVIGRLREIVREENIQVINCHLHRTLPLGLAAAWSTRPRPIVLSTLHGLGNAHSLRRKLGNALLYAGVHKVIGVSEAVREDILRSNWRLPESKVVTIANGLDFRRFLGDCDREEIRRQLFPWIKADCWFGTVGRLAEVKNHRNLILAFRQVVDVQPSSALLITGQGELESSLKSLVLDTGLQDHVFFLGFRLDIPKILKALDAFVFPSLREGLPLAILEAMASELPVIASRVGGIPEIFGDSAIGSLVEPTDPQSLAAAMLEIVAMPVAGRRQLGRNAARRALSAYSAERMVQAYSAVYQDAFEHWRQHSNAAEADSPRMEG